MTEADNIQAKAEMQEILAEVIAGKLKPGAEIWDRLRISGTPFCNDADSDGKCFGTFVYRGNEHTKAVRLELPPFSRLSPERFVMSRVEDTDLWYLRVELPAKSRFMYGFVENAENGADIRDLLQPDEFNALRFGRRSCVETPGVERLPDVFETSTAEDVVKSLFNSQTLQNQRHLWIYKTPGFDSAKTSSLLVCFDGEIYLNDMNAATVLNNLSGKGLIPQTVALFVGSAEERRNEELTANGLFSQFVANELFDHASSNFLISDRLADRIVCGASFGGLASLHAGLSYPQVFGGIIAQSASLWSKSKELSELVSKMSGQKPAIYMDAGRYEIEERNGSSLLEANRMFSNTLKTKGYEVIYQEFNGGHGAANWRGTFPDAVIKLFGMKPKPKSAAVRTELF